MAKGLGAIIADSIGENSKNMGVSMWLDTGFPPLNKAISGDYDGGMPVGRIVEMFGPESSGKTAIATQVMIAAQKAGGLAIFMDHENSFDEDIADQHGLQMDTGNNDPWVYHTPSTFEESVTKVIKVCRDVREQKGIEDDAPIVVVFDSLASMVPQSKFAKEITEQGMNDSLALAKSCSAVMPTLALYASQLNMLVIFLNQEREKPGVMYGDPTTTPGGRAPKFYSSVRIQLGRTMLKSKDKKSMIGQEVKCKVIKNKVSKPFETAEWRFLFREEDGSGYFDVVGSMVDYYTSKGILKVSGAYIEWIDGKRYHKQPLIDKINNEGLQGELLALLPK